MLIKNKIVKQKVENPDTQIRHEKGVRNMANKYSGLNGYETIKQMIRNNSFPTNVSNKLIELVKKYDTVGDEAIMMQPVGDNVLTDEESSAHDVIMRCASLTQLVREKHYFKIELILTRYIQSILN
jgi:predicted xylose isomerase-like sugar epimerase|tara:strand:+ start:72 stop:449 length:378 start_codon:yes stop_codon:yes gene_type:complete